MTETPLPPDPPDDRDAGNGAEQPTVSDSPDALGNPDVDEVRGSDQGDDVVGDADDPYELRSMPTQPNPTDEDPASYLNR